MTTDLHAQQQALGAAVRGAALAPGLLAAAPGGAAPRLDVYREAYRLRLVAALRDNHEVLARAMGDEAFDALATAYLAAHPPTRPSIRWFGDRLAAFMDGDGAAWVPHPALADLARLDWALRTAFDAAEAPLLDAAALAAIPAADWPAQRFVPHPGAQSMRLQWAIAPAWHALQDHDPARGDPEPALPPPEHAPHAVLVWRQGLQTRWRVLDEVEAALWPALAAGQPFEALCARAAEAVADGDDDAAAQRVAQALAGWVAAGLLSAG